VLLNCSFDTFVNSRIGLPLLIRRFYQIFPADAGLDMTVEEELKRDGEGN